MQALRIFVKGTIFFLWCALLAPLQALFLHFNRGKAAYTIPQLWHQGMCRVFGLQVLVQGAPLHNQQTLFVCNHVSYLDIPVIASVLKASFVARKGVASWPIFGTLARLQQTAFISQSQSDAQKEKNALSTLLDEGKSLILFPEGTSTDGTSVMPFKSSLFSITLHESRNGLMVQPMTLSVESVDGRPASDRSARDLYAWYTDMTMPAHLKAFTSCRGAVIRLTFHPPVDPKLYSERKTLADDCHAAVQAGMEQQNLAAGLAA